MKRLLKRLVCLLLGHKWKLVAMVAVPGYAYFGHLHKQKTVFDCIRCGRLKVGRRVIRVVYFVEKMYVYAPFIPLQYVGESLCQSKPVQ